MQLRRIPAIVATLGASFVWTGVGYSLQPTPGGGSPEWLTAALGWSIGVLSPMPFLIILFGLAAMAVDRAPLGVVLRAFGGNPGAMARGGWSPLRYAVIRYLIAGGFGLLAGLSLTAVNTASDINAGGPFTLLSVAAVVMGGCSLLGGRVAPFGVIAGAVTLSLIGALLSTLNVNTNYSAAVQGVILLAMLLIGAAVSRRRSEQ
jgi:ribose transport system ATP-binding protein